MSEHIDLDDFHATKFPLGLKKGMAWVLYSDEGPAGICGQSMRITCPHAVLKVYATEDEMRSEMETAKFRNGKRSRLMWGVVGDFTAGGVFSVAVSIEAANAGGCDEDSTSE